MLSFSHSLITGLVDESRNTHYNGVNNYLQQESIDGFLVLWLCYVFFLHFAVRGGRPRILLEFNTHEQAVIGVDRVGTKLYGAVTDLGEQLLHEINLDYHGTSGEASYKCLIGLLERVIARTKADRYPIRGIGVGAPGMTLYPSGVVAWPELVRFLVEGPTEQVLWDGFNCGKRCQPGRVG